MNKKDKPESGIYHIPPPRTPTFDEWQNLQHIALIERLIEAIKAHPDLRRRLREVLEDEG